MKNLLYDFYDLIITILSLEPNDSIEHELSVYNGRRKLRKINRQIKADRQKEFLKNL